MEYNTTRSKMLMPEYGRNVQRMIEHLMTIEERDKRLKSAEAIIELMGTLNPQLKTVEDYEHKLWDHLYLITDFKLDVDGPYPMPSREQMTKRPEPLSYPQTKIERRHFGKNLMGFIKVAMKEEDEEKRQAMTQIIGYYMKLAYINYHREPVHDDMIKNELSVLTEGKLIYEPGGYKVYFDNNNNRNYKQRRNKGGGNNRNNNYGNNKNRKYNKNRK